MVIEFEASQFVVPKLWRSIAYYHDDPNIGISEVWNLTVESIRKITTQSLMRIRYNKKKDFKTRYFLNVNPEGGSKKIWNQKNYTGNGYDLKVEVMARCSLWAYPFFYLNVKNTYLVTFLLDGRSFCRYSDW